MGKTKTRKCIVCGKEYEYCNRCESYAAFPAWMSIFHDENCKKIMSIATEYRAGNLTKAEAKIRLDGCDISNKKNFSDSILKTVNEICSGRKFSKADIVKVEEDIKTEPVVDIVEDIVSEPVVDIVENIEEY